MKTQNTVKMLVAGIGCMVVASCTEYQPPSSIYGTGTYRCYYHNLHTGRFVKGVADTRKKAIKNARVACLKTLLVGMDHDNCEYMECLFK